MLNKPREAWTKCLWVFDGIGLANDGVRKRDEPESSGRAMLGVEWFLVKMAGEAHEEGEKAGRLGVETEHGQSTRKPSAGGNGTGSMESSSSGGGWWSTSGGGGLTEMLQRGRKCSAFIGGKAPKALESELVAVRASWKARGGFLIVGIVWGRVRGRFGGEQELELVEGGALS